MTTPCALAKPIHVSMFTPTPDGGHARYSKELLLELAAAGASRGVSVSLTTSTNLDPAHFTDRYPVHAFLPPTVPRDGFRSPLSWAVSRIRHYRRRDKAFVDWAISNRITAVHVQEYTPWNAFFDFRRLRRHGVRVFATVHNIRWNDYPPLMPHWLPNWSNRIAWRACDGLFVHTESLKRELSERLGPGHPPIWVMPHGVWTAPRKAATPADTAARLARRQLLFFGVVTPYKGADVLVRALEHLPDYSIVIAGASDDPDYAARLRKLAAQFPSGKVRIEDRFLAEEEIGPLFDGCSLVVLPYLTFASQSGVLHDAVAHGVPVIASDLGAIGESVRSWGIGEVVEPGNPVDLARGVRSATILENYARAVAATERVREERSWGASARVVLDAYEQVLHG